MSPTAPSPTAAAARRATASALRRPGELADAEALASNAAAIPGRSVLDEDGGLVRRRDVELAADGAQPEDRRPWSIALRLRPPR
jgi:hypothetical protein